MKNTATIDVRRVLCFSSAIFALATVTPAYAEAENYAYRSPAPDEWIINATPQLISGSYSSTASRDSMSGYGLSTDFQYLERGGISLGAASTTLKFKSAAATDTVQTSYNLGGRINCTPDPLPGILTLRLDLDRVSNNDSTNETNGVSVLAPQVSFLNYAKTYYLDFGYARSTYGDSNAGKGSLAVTQLTPTVGFGFNDGAEWLQLRSYLIKVSNVARSNNNESTSAFDMKWTHYLSGEDMLPEQLIVGALVGKRMYAVDGSNVYNLSDIQKGGASLAAQWSVSSSSHLYLQTGQDSYDAISSGVAYSYTASYWFLGLNGQW